MKTSRYSLEKLSLEEVSSKFIHYNLVSNKKTSAGLDSFWVMTEEPIHDQIYFLIADSDKTLSEQLMDDPLGIISSS